MAWDFATDPAFQARLDWADEFVRNEVEPLDFVVTDPRDVLDPLRAELIPPLQAHVRANGLWACHLGPEFGGQGFGHVQMALLNEILGRSVCAPTVFGCQAPDSNTATILARYGSDELRRRYLQPLLDGEVSSCFSATELQGGADPKVFTTRAERDRDEWVINGEKWFSSGAEKAAFLLVMAVTDPQNPPYRRLSIFVVPRETPGIDIVRNVATGIGSGDARHSHVRYDDVRVPLTNLLGDRGGAFAVMQSRMSVARLGLATRGLGRMRRAFDLMCERAVSRTTQGEPLGDKQLVQEMIAETWAEVEQFRLLVLRTAWKLDQEANDVVVRADIAAVKMLFPRVLHDVGARAAQIHGSLGVSHDMPFAEMVLSALQLGVADGPTEVHKITLARQLLRDCQPNPDAFPSYHIPARRAEARARYADVLGRHRCGGSEPTGL
jgi:acyl-CoA dehydrogenase